MRTTCPLSGVALRQGLGLGSIAWWIECIQARLPSSAQQRKTVNKMAGVVAAQSVLAVRRPCVSRPSACRTSARTVVQAAAQPQQPRKQPSKPVMLIKAQIWMQWKLPYWLIRPWSTTAHGATPLPFLSSVGPPRCSTQTAEEL